MHENWKYVVFREDIPVLIPPTIDHSQMRPLEESLGKITSAGRISLGDNGVKCYGESTTLGIKSDPRDTRLLNSYHLIPSWE
jgi:hypothetical protein